MRRHDRNASRVQSRVKERNIDEKVCNSSRAGTKIFVTADKSKIQGGKTAEVSTRNETRDVAENGNEPMAGRLGASSWADTHPSGMRKDAEKQKE